MEEVQEEDVTTNDGGGGGGGGGAAVGGDGVRVLVVDDSPVDRKIVESLLKRNGGMFQVIAVGSAKAAMEVLGLNQGNAKYPNTNEQKVDIILTDYCMPEMTGYDLLKAIKEHSSSRSVPVVIMSSENDPQRISSCLAIGAEEFILKPLHINDVQRLRNYARPASAPAPKPSTKRKLPPDLIVEGNGSARRPRLAGVVVA